MLILRFQTSFIYCIMFTKERQFKQVLTSKSFIIEKSLSGFVRKVELYEIVAKNRSLFRHYYTVILTQGLSNFYLSITPFTEAGFKQSVFIDNVIPSGFTVLLTSPEAATRVVLYKKLLLKILQYSQENTYVGVSFIKRRLQHRWFPVNIAKCLRTPILMNSYECRLLRLTLGPHLRVQP